MAESFDLPIATPKRAQPEALDRLIGFLKYRNNTHIGAWKAILENTP